MAGQYLLMVHGDTQTVQEAQTLRRDTNPVDDRTHAAASATARPTSQIAAERERAPFPRY